MSDLVISKSERCVNRRAHPVHYSAGGCSEWGKFGRMQLAGQLAVNELAGEDHIAIGGLHMEGYGIAAEPDIFGDAIVHTVFGAEPEFTAPDAVVEIEGELEEPG